MKRSFVTTALLALLFIGTPATAQEPDPRAFEHFDAGAQLYFEKKYEEAIEEFEQGYSIQAHPILQVNIALAQWRLGNLDAALEAGRIASLSEAQLGPEVSTENAARMRAWEATLSARERSAAVERRAAVSAASETPAEVGVEATGEQPPPSSGFGALGWTGVVAATAGAGLTVSWAFVELGLGDGVEKLEAAGEAGDREAYDAALDDVQRQQRVARIVLGSGVGLMAAGGVLILLDALQPSDGERVSLQVGPGGEPIVGISGRF